MMAVERGPGLAGYRDLVPISRTDTALVFEAVRDSDARRVAVKVLLVDHEVAEQARAWRELTTTVLLSAHPHIVEILDTGVTARGNPYVVMEHCPDGSYERMIDRLGPLSVDETVLVGSRIAEALQAAHDVGVVHGAVKSSNILRAPAGPALCDFGIARVPVADRSVELEESASSDLFDLAATLGHLLAGQPLSAGSAGRRRPATSRDDVPEWLWFELDRALAPDPDDRHPSAYAFAEILRAHSDYVAEAPLRPEPLPFGDNDAIEGSLVLPSGVWAASGHTEPPPAEPLPPDGSRTTFGPDPPWPSDPRAVDAGVDHPGTGEDDRWRADDYDGDDRSADDRRADDGERRRADNPDGDRRRADNPAPAYAEPDRTPDGYAAPYDEPDRAFGDDSPWFDEPPRRRPWRTLALGLAAAAMVAVAGFMFWPTGDGDEPGGAVPGNSLSAVSPMQVTGEGAPTDVKLTDNGSMITVTWSDTTGKRAQFAVVGGPRGTPLTLQKVLDPGSTALTLQGLNTRQDYCYQVLAILRVDEYARSTTVCTSRS